MSAKNRAVFGIYISQLDAENAVHGLKLAGFRSTDISILFPDNTGTKDLALERNSKAPEGTAAGAGGGAVVGGILGWLAGVGLLAIPGLGMFVAAGPIMAMLSGIGVGGVLGGVAAHWWGWERQSTKPNAMKAAFARAAFCSPCIATIGSGRRRRARSWIRPAPKTFRRPPKRRPISPRAIGPRSERSLRRRSDRDYWVGIGVQA